METQRAVKQLDHRRCSTKAGERKQIQRGDDTDGNRAESKLKQKQRAKRKLVHRAHSQSEGSGNQREVKGDKGESTT